MLRRFSTSRRRALAALGTAAWALRAEAAHEVRPWPPGKSGPAVPLVDIDGRAWDPAMLEGQVLLLNFWATWCEPCRAEMPSLEQLQSRRSSEGLRVLAVNFKEAGPTVRRFLSATPLALPVALDVDGNAARAWGVRVLPSTVLIDRLGRPRGTVLGELDWSGEAAAMLLDPLFAAGRRS